MDGTGFLTWTDRDVVAGGAYDYRLGVAGPEGERFYGETHVVVPDQSVVSLEGMQPNPSDGPMLVSFSLAGRDAASLDLLDVTGRRLIRREVGSLGVGRHFVRLDESGKPLPAGLYFLRLAQDGHARTAKIVIER